MEDAGNVRSKAVRASMRLATSFEDAVVAVGFVGFVGVVVSAMGGGVGLAWLVIGSLSSCEAGTRAIGTRMALGCRSGSGLGTFVLIQSIVHNERSR